MVECSTQLTKFSKKGDLHPLVPTPTLLAQLLKKPSVRAGEMAQRSWVQIPTTEWWITAICNESLSLLLECLKTATVLIQRKWIYLKQRKKKPSVQCGGRGRRIFVESCLAQRSTSRTWRATQRNPASKNKNKQTENLLKMEMQARPAGRDHWFPTLERQKGAICV